MLEVTPSLEDSDFTTSKLIQKPNMDQFSMDFYSLGDEGHYEENPNKNTTQATDNDLAMRRNRDFFETKEPPDKSDDFDPGSFLDPPTQTSSDPQPRETTESSTLLLFGDKQLTDSIEPDTATPLVENLTSSFDKELEKYAEDTFKSIQNI